MRLVLAKTLECLQGQLTIMSNAILRIDSHCFLLNALMHLIFAQDEQPEGVQ